MAIVAGDLGHVAEHNRLTGVPLGTLASGYAQVTANQAGITTAADLTGLTVTVTAGTSRRLRITAQTWWISTVNGDYAQLEIHEGATVLNSSRVALTTGSAATLLCIAIITPSAGAHTYKLVGVRALGTGSLTMSAGANNAAFIHVEDIGV